VHLYIKKVIFNIQKNYKGQKQLIYLLLELKKLKNVHKSLYFIYFFENILITRCSGDFVNFF